MPEDKFRDFIKAQFDLFEVAGNHEERVEALRRLFCAKMVRCAEAAIDAEMAPIEGVPMELQHTLRPESVYHPYHMARRSGFADFSEEQRQVLKGLVQHTAFQVMDSFIGMLDSMIGFQVGVSLWVYDEDLKTEYRLRSLETDDVATTMAETGLPRELTKYEY